MTWPGTGGGNPVFATTTSEVDFSTLQAFNLYTAEFYVNSNPGVPIVEITRILAPVEQPSAYVQRPLHNLSPSVASVTPPQSGSSSITAAWIRNSLATRIENVYFAYTQVSGPTVVRVVPVTDAFSLTPTSTDTVIPISAPAMSTTPGNENREIGMTGFSARASFQQSVFWQN